MSDNRSRKIKDLNKITEDPEAYARNVELNKLIRVLHKLSDYYYGEKKSLVDDETYDIMVDVLGERDPNNPYLFQAGVCKPTDKDIKLPFSMPSLNKVRPREKSLQSWFNKHKGPYVIMDKLDGISVQVFKNKEGDIDIFTKKQTNMGTSKKYLLNYLLDNKIIENLPNNTSVRGEVVISKKDFEHVKTIDTDLKNPRSAMAGLINTDTIDVRIAKRAQYVTYNILSPRYTISKQLEKLQKWGFKVVWNNVFDIDEYDKYSPHEKYFDIEEKLKDILKERMRKSEFLIDGIVITNDSKIYSHTENNPKYSIAFKMNIAANMKDACIEEVIWKPTMYSYLQPIIRIKPIMLSGNTTVSFVTAHNAKYVRNNKIGKGAIVKVVRSNEVIPYIVDVIEPSEKPDMPNIEYEWNDTNVDIIAVNPSGETLRKIRIKQNLHFFKELGIKYLSDGIIAKLYDCGYQTIISIISIASNKNEEPYEICGLGEKTITKIYNQIDEAFEKIKLPKLMSGSLKFGRGLGAKKIKEVIKVYPDVLRFRNRKIEKIREKIMKVPGFSDILATKFAEGIKPFCEFLDELKENSNYNYNFAHKKKKKDIDIEEDIEEDIDMSEQKIVLTGFRSKEVEEFIEKNGGKVSSGVSKNTTLVVYVPTCKISSKLQKAQDLNIPIMTKEEFEKIHKLT